jgi:hypothetical protein
VQRKTATRITVVLVSLGVLGFGVLKMVPYFVDEQALKRAIEDGLHQSTGVNFHIRELQLNPTVFHGIQVHLNTSTITNMKKQPLGSIGNITIQIRYWPILTQQLPEIAKIHLNHVLIPVGTQNFFKELHLKLVPPKRTGFLKPAEMRDTEILLSDYVIEDTVLSNPVRRMWPYAQGFALRGQDLSLRHLQSSKPISLLGDGVLAFIPENAWTGKAPVLSVGHPSRISQTVHAKLMLEIPQSATRQSTLNLGDLGKLALNLTGANVDLDLNYQRYNDQPGHTPGGAGSLQSPGLELMRGQALALQLGDTFGIRLPDSFSQTMLAGRTTLNNRFRFSFPSHAQTKLDWVSGNLRLKDIAIAPFNRTSRPWLGRVNGTVNFQGQQIQTHQLAFALDGLPVVLKGWYRLDNQQVNALITAKNLKVTSLKDTVAGFGVTSPAIQALNFQGLLDFNAAITGTANQPSYQGALAVKNGRFQDAAQGLVADNLNGRVQFKGFGLKKPVVQYQGRVNVVNGLLVNAKQGLDVQHFDGNVDFKGQYQPGPAQPLPAYNGQINVRQAKYQDPKSGVLVSDIKGLIRLGGDWIHLENFRGLLAGANLTANGQLKSNLTDYHVKLQGDHIDLPRLKRELAPKFPAVKPILAQLDPYQGQARLDLNIDTGMTMSGRIDVATLAMRTSQPDYPLQVPRLSLLFTNRQITVPDTVLYLGPVAIHLAGQASQSGQYNFKVASGDIPVSFLRDNESLLASLSGASLPEIWNTAGSFKMRGSVASQGNQMNLDFQNAGLSWQSGDFPLYDLNGSLSYQQAGKGLPAIASRNLNFRYGNSPVSVSLDHHGQLNAVAEGVLSALTVNHFLVSRQSEATPYRDVPFQISANGLLAALPSAGVANRAAMQKNDVKAYLHLNLEPNFRHAYDGTVEQPTPLPTQSIAAHANARDEETSPSGSGAALSLIHPVRTVNHVLNTARQTVQSGLDALIGTTRATAALLPSFGKSANPSADSGRTTGDGSSSGLNGNRTVIAPAAPVNPEPPPYAPGDPGAAYLSSTIHWAGPNLHLDQAQLHLFDAGDLVADGSFDNFLDLGKRVFLLRMSAQPGIDLDKLSQGASSNLFFKDAKGKLALDIQVAGNSEGPKLAGGWIEAKKIAIPYITVRDLTGRVALTGETAQAVVDNFEIPGVAVSATGRTLNIFEMPISLEDVKIHGRLLSIESLGAFSNLVVRPILVDQLAHNFMRPWQQGDPTIPIQFRNADLNVDEVIYQNIILNNLTSQFSVYANSFFELSNTSIQAAGGTAHGYLSMSPNDSSFTTLELNVDSVKANALTKALLNVTNQIFGDVNGTVRFTTFGDTDADMQQNANGTVSVRVINGRLPAIAKVETLLTTANIIRGGLLGLNLNNLLRSLTFYDTNYFATMSGDMLINNQVLYTRNLTSLGVNLDLLIRGSLRMDNGNANMVVDGRMRQVVAGKLGAVGKLSLGGLVSYIPALGTFGKNRTGLLGYIPGVGWVPGFGGPAGDVNRFRVRLVGDLNTPGAVQDFHWVH